MDPKVDLEVDGKVAIITGAGSGICLALATLLLSKGCNVVIADLALQPSASELLTTYTRTSPAATPSTSSSSSYSSSSSSSTFNPNKRPQCLFHPTDVTSWPDLTALFEYTLSNFPLGIDIIVPGAGLFEPLSSNFYYPPGSPLSQDSYHLSTHNSQEKSNERTPSNFSPKATRAQARTTP